MMLELFEFSDPRKGHFMSLPKPLMNSLQILGNGRGCFNLYLLILWFCLQDFFYWLNFFIRWYKCASLGLTVLGAYLIANHAIRYILEKRRRSELQKRYASLPTNWILLSAFQLGRQLYNVVMNKSSPLKFKGKYAL